MPSFVVTGRLKGNNLVHLKSAQMVSLSTGQKLPMQIQVKDGMMDVSDAELIPPGANIRLAVSLRDAAKVGSTDLEKRSFLEKWGSYKFVVEFDDRRFEEVIPRDVVLRRFTEEGPAPEPQVTRKTPR